jgi:hypothetical protein
MSPDTFAALRRDLAGRDVLTVYIKAEQHDPTQRSSWRLRLKRSLDEQEQIIAEDDAQPFAAARHAVEAELTEYTGFLPGRGWVLFATHEGVHYASQEPVPLPDRAVWRRGPVLGPLTRAIKQDRPVVVALIDSLRARLFEYRNGELHEEVDQRADAFIDDLTDRNMSKRATTASGTRGATATDVAERILRVQMERHARGVAETLLSRSGGAIAVVGGPTLAVTELRKLLEPALGERLHVDDTLHLAMTTAQLVGPVEEAASRTTARMQESALRRLQEAAAPGGPVALGSRKTASACEAGQVERLYLTAAALNAEGADAEALIAAALDRGGAVELLSGAAADALDATTDGVAARLRYAPGVAPNEMPSILGLSP